MSRNNTSDIGVCERRLGSGDGTLIIAKASVGKVYSKIYLGDQKDVLVYKSWAFTALLVMPS